MNRFLAILLICTSVLPHVLAASSGTVTGDEGFSDLDWELVNVSATANSETLGDLAVSQTIVGLLWADNTNTEVWFSSYDGSTVNNYLVFDEDGSISSASMELAFVANERWIAIWTDTTNTDMMFAITENNGATWNTTTADSGIGPLAAPRIHVWTVDQYSVPMWEANENRVWTTNNTGESWTRITCALDASRDVQPKYMYGFSTDYAILGPKTTNPEGGEFSYLRSPDSCATLATLEGPSLTQTYSSSHIAKGANSPDEGWVGGSGDNFGFYFCPGENDQDATDGIWFWPYSYWAIPRTIGEGITATIQFPNARDTGCNLRMWDGGSDLAIMYRTDSGNQAGSWAGRFISYDLSTLTTATNSQPAVYGDVLVFGNSEGNDILLWVSDPVPLAGEPVPPSEFDAGLKATVESLGFRTPESQFFFVLILVGIATVVAAALLKILPGGTWSSYTIFSVAAVVGAFCVLLLFLELWTYTLALVLGGVIVMGGKELRNTWQETRQAIPRAFQRSLSPNNVLAPEDSQGTEEKTESERIEDGSPN